MKQKSVIYQGVEITQIVNRVFNSCTYVLTHDGRSWLVDCGDVEPVLAQVDGNLSGVLLTHAHFDHIYGLNRLLTVFPDVPVYTNREGLEGLMSDKLNFSRYHEEPFILAEPGNARLVDDGEIVMLFEGINAQAIATPGHSPACITWIVEDALFTGDSYIPGIKTVTNFPHSDKMLARESEERIRRLARDRRIYPGHAPQDETITNQII